MKQQRKALALAAALVISVANIAAVAQQTLDRTKVPTPGCNACVACSDMDQNSVVKWRDVDRL